MATVGANELALLTVGLDENARMVFQTQYASEKKDRTLAVLIAFFWGADRIYLGQIGLGIVKILTIWIFVWWLIDLFTAAERADDFNRAKAHEIANSLRSAGGAL